MKTTVFPVVSPYERDANATGMRKTSQHNANMMGFGPRLGWVLGLQGIPLVRKCSMLMKAKNAVGSNTPGAASSAADLEAQEAPKSEPKPEKIDV